ncbi:NAD(P)-dependent oxidoreductase [Pseudokineococcus marinus]|uniref:NAD(P)-dependent oxidoreductase n=1 Tax=Pseudokineococcus marinus TaxID=351215 RepID=A0A849BS95_9ACTN|nr:NAD(P)-dependent oxidoreductase [Pseudokineococcus marinus]NNH24425.1 NAD(P)-dependent oxidoreductase [Pseudokineococcus marinus]
MSAATGAAGGPRVLVTGASGFVGRHVVRELRAAGAVVSAVDRTEHPDVPTTLGDLRDAGVRERSVVPGLDAVVHLAAITSVLGSVEQPAETTDLNVVATAGLLELCRERGVGAFVLASTNAVVGDVGAGADGRGTITEALPLRPLTPYGATKAAGEMLLSGYAGAFGLRAPVVRLTNVYGPGMRAKDSFVPRLMRAAAEGRGVVVYGDGEQRRDLVHVHDAARALAQAALGWPSGPVIVGGARSYTVNEMVAAAREATGAPIPVDHQPARPGEMPAVVVDVSRARSLGYAPSTALAEGMATVWPDFRPAGLDGGDGSRVDGGAAAGAGGGARGDVA